MSTSNPVFSVPDLHEYRFTRLQSKTAVSIMRQLDVDQAILFTRQLYPNHRARGLDSHNSRSHRIPVLRLPLDLKLVGADKDGAPLPRARETSSRSRGK